MTEAERTARNTGLLLFATLFSFIMTFQTMPAFDARQGFFDDDFPRLAGQRIQFALALFFSALTSLLSYKTSTSLKKAFITAGNARSFAAPVLLGVASIGCLVSTVLGIPMLTILFQASRILETDLSVFSASALPWAGANQAFLVIFGLGAFVLSLLMIALSLIRSGCLPLRWAAAGLTLPVIPLLVFLSIPGEDPFFFLALGLPALFWSAGTSIYIIITRCLG